MKSRSRNCGCRLAEKWNFDHDPYRVALAAILFLALVGCAVTRDDAIRITKSEIARRNLPLPKHYRVDTRESFVLIGYTYGGELFRTYVVTYGTNKTPLYEFTVERYTGKIREFEHKRESAARSTR